MASEQVITPEFVAKQRLEVIQKLAVRSKKNPQFETPSEEEANLLERLDVFLDLLNNDLVMTPQFKQKTQIDKGMEVVFDGRFSFPQQHVEKAKALYEKWESDNWGAPVVTKHDSPVDDEDDDIDASDSSAGQKRKRRTPSTGNRDRGAILQLPHPDDPIWGMQGIMHGALRVRNGSRTNTQRDERYNKRIANVFGHNKIEVGTWFAFQLIALFKGAHGSSQAGIYGNETTGAYSVVVSGQYDDLDHDYGDKLYYSGSGSHENTDPKNPAKSTHGTNALHTSIYTQKPVRVLRSYTGKSKWAPTVGYRYDGLYKVTEVNYPENAKGGMFEQFKLVRCEDQAPINTSRPSSIEVRDYDEIKRQFRTATS